MEQNNIIPLQEVRTMGEIAARSRLFGLDDPTAATALMLMAQAEGRHPMLAARDYHIIKGRPALKADAILARFQQAGGKVEWKDLSDQKVAATFTHPQGGTALIDWDMERARKAQLTGNTSWQKYPRQMLRARVISEGVRTTFPAVLCGFYTPEEVEDFDSRDPIPSGDEHVERASRRRRRSREILAEAAANAAPNAVAVEVQAEVVKEDPVPEQKPEPAPAPKPEPKGSASEIAERMAAKAEQKQATIPEPKPDPVVVTDEESAWIDSAKEAADFGVSVSDLKEKAYAKFGRPLPAKITGALMEIWKSQQNQNKEEKNGSAE